MTFNNVQVDVSALPDALTVDYERVDPRFAPINAAVAVVIQAFVLVTIAVGAQFENDLQAILAAPMPVFVGVGFLFVAVPLVVFLHCRAYGYAVREHDIVLRKGLFWRAEIVQPLIRLQHVELVRGPLEKALGLAKLKLFSAGSGRETFTIPGLPLRNAARLRRYALTSARQSE